MAKRFQFQSINNNNNNNDVTLSIFSNFFFFFEFYALARDTGLARA